MRANRIGAIIAGANMGGANPEKHLVLGNGALALSQELSATVLCTMTDATLSRLF